MPEVEEQIQAIIIRNHRLQPSMHNSFDIRNMEEIRIMLAATGATMAMLLLLLPPSHCSWAE